MARADRDEASIDLEAAPDLLAALELVLDHEGHLTDGDWTVIHAAITKALQ